LDKKGAKMKVSRYFLFTALLCYCNFALAHLGSPGVNYQGKAGNYNILVNIIPPDVIPGAAAVSIFIENYKNEKVSVQTFYYDAGKNGSVPAEMATPVKGANGWFEDSDWLMWRGATSIKIVIKGDHGTGSVSIPVMSVATADRGMPLWLGLVLITFGLLLFALMIAMVTSSVSDALLKPGSVMPPNVRRKRLRASLITIFVVMICLFYAYKACHIERKNYLDYLYKPIEGHSAVFKYNAETMLRLHVDSESLIWVHQPFAYIVPDHEHDLRAFTYVVKWVVDKYHSDCPYLEAKGEKIIAITRARAIAEITENETFTPVERGAVIAGSSTGGGAGPITHGVGN
jgi:hypothetical protein